MTRVLTLETVSGKIIDIDNPVKDDFNIVDIAWGLSRIPRFAGHTITKIPYSVAQHSLMVERIVEQALEDHSMAWISPDINIEFLDSKSKIIIRLQALIHDAMEAYTGDLPSPIKKHPFLYDGIKKIEDKLMQGICSSLSIPVPTESSYKFIKYADDVSKAIEAHAFMVSRGKNWENMPEVSLLDLQNFEAPIVASEVYKMFIQKYDELKGKM